MGLDIVTNTMASEASNDISTNQTNMQGALEQLSSGYQINSPADDAAGYVISQNLQAQIGGFQQAQANTQAGVNVVQTADGALNEVSSILQTINTLAVQSANTSATDSTAQNADQAEVNQALASIVDIAKTTVYGNNQLLVNGTAATVNYTFQVGNDDTTASQVVFSLTALNLANLGLVTDSLDLATGASADGVSSVSASGLAANSTYTVAVSNLSTGSVAGAAMGTTNFASQITFGITLAGSLALVTIAASSTIGQIAADVSNGLAAVGLATTDITVATGSSSISLTNALGAGAGGNGVFVISGPAAGLASLGLTAGTYAGTSSLSVGGGSGVTVTYAELNAGDTFDVAGSSGASFAVTLNTNLSATSFTATASYSNGADLNLVNFSITSSTAIGTITNAIDAVSSLGGTLGAAQDELTDIADNETVMVQNLQSSNAQIKDANMANEMVAFTQDQTLVQAGVSMLAQANQIPQYVLKLLG